MRFWRFAVGACALAGLIAARPVAGAESNPNARGGWFLRGATNIVPYVAFLVPVDLEKGVSLASTGDNTNRFSGAFPWMSRIDRFSVTNYQYNPAVGAHTLPVQNPLAAFGGGAAGTRLATGRSYAFGFYAGAHPTNSLASIPSLRIAAYRKSDFASPGASGILPVTNATISVPVPPYRGGTNAAEWAAFAATDFSKTVEFSGLRSTLRLVEGDYQPPRTDLGEEILLPSTWGNYQSYWMEHLASSDEYYYLIELKGYLPVQGEPPMIADSGGAARYYPLYGLDFEERPPWTCELVDRPSFQAEPVPPQYRDKSPEELLGVRSAVPDFAQAPIPAQCLALDGSPDLRAHPELDGLVEDLKSGDPEKDAMTLANFVLNEIELTDPISYHDDGAYDSQSINAGGVCRNALGVYREGQGNPAEICSLLVYMLRKAGIPAAYAFPAPNSLKMLDERVSELLRVQIVGALDLLNNQDLWGLPAATTNQFSARIPALVPVNYPWVAAHVPVAAEGGTNRWVHVFPWLADTEMREGGDLYDHLRAVDASDTDGVGSAMDWVRRYINADTNLLSLAEDNVPAAIFPKYIERRLRRNFPGVSIDDLGIRHRNRKHYFTAWEEFPRPFTVTAAPIWRQTLDSITNLFDTLELEILDPNETVVTNTGPMRLCDIQDRRLLVRYDKVAPATSSSGHADPGGGHIDLGWVYTGRENNGLQILRIQNYYTSPVSGQWVGPVDVEVRFEGGDGNGHFSIQDESFTLDTYGEGKWIEIDFAGLQEVGWQSAVVHWDVFLHGTQTEIDEGELPIKGIVYELPDNTLTVSLAAFRDSAAGTNGFGGLANPLLTAQQLSVPVPAGVGGHYVRVRREWHRNYTGGLGVEPFLDVYSRRFAEYSRGMFVGDMAAICLDYGRVTPRMLRPHAEEFWRMERALDANPSWKPSRDQYQGGAAYLMGMSSFDSMCRFDALNQGLHKFRLLSSRMMGFYQLRPFAPGGVVPPGEYQMVEPAIDFAYSWAALARSGAVHLDSGNVMSEAVRDYGDLFTADTSAHEHFSIDRFFRQSTAISTVKLLQIAAQNTNAVVELTRENYAAAGTNLYAGVALQDHDPVLWSSIVGTFSATPADGAQFTKIFVTPGSQDGGDDGDGGTSYRGMGALVMGKFFRAAWISADQNDNGGRGGYLDPLAMAAENVVNLSLEPYPDLGFYLDTSGGPSASDPAMLPSLFADYDMVRIADGADAGFYYFSEADMEWRTAAARALALDDALSFGDMLVASADRGLPATDSSWWGDFSKVVLDPVHAITGEFYHDAVDLALPGPMPLSVRRNYTSQNLADNQFGVGWKLAHMPFLAVAAGETNIWAAELDGSVLVYTRQGGGDVWKAQPEDNPNLNSVSGGLANMAEARIERAGGGGPGTVYRLITPDRAVRTFTVRSYPIGTGANLIQRTRPYLDSWRDPNGNTYSYFYYTNSALPEYGQLRRIEAANGNCLGLYYDVAGHITEAYTGDGRRVKYRYDDYGDLVEVTLPDGAVHAYGYEHRTDSNGIYSTHLLVREDKPEGNVLENTYDSLRRVTEQRSTVGENGALVRNGTFVYLNATNADGTVSGETLVIDAYGRTNRYEYDQSQYTRIEDAAGNVTLMDWYQPGDPRPGAYPRSLASRTDPRSLVTEYRYDSRGNPTNIIARGDLTGDGNPNTEAATTAIFSTNNVPLQVTEPSGHHTTFGYADTNYPLLATLVQRFAPGGTLVAATSNAYTQVAGPKGTIGGLLQKTIRDPGSANPAVTDFSYNDEGFAIGTTQYPGSGDPDVTVIFRRNLRDEIVERRDAAGRKINFSYDNLGRLTGTEYREASGALIGWNYDYFDGNGNKTWSDGPRWFPEDYVWRKFDKAGRPLEEARWRSRAKADASGTEAPTGEDLWASTFYTHDLFGNLRLIVDPNRNLTEMDYDPIGRMTARRVYQGTSTSQLLSRESFGYEPGGQIAVHTNALNGVTRTYYTATGKPKERHNPDGTTETWRYLPDGRIARETYRNDSYLDYAYQDATRTVTRTLYSPTGGFLAADSKTFDSRGNAISETDRDGNTWVRTFDGLDRPKTVTGPDPGGDSDPQSSTCIYDAAGVSNIVQNATNERTVTIRDAMGRTTSVDVKDASGVTVRRTSYAYGPDHHGVTVTEGSGPGAIAITTLTDTAGATVARNWSDGAFERWEFDPAGNPTAYHDPLNRTTTYAHDALGRRSSETLPDGAATAFLYDGLGNLTARILPGGLTETNAYDVAGRLLTSALVNGGNSSRSVSRSYYSSGNGAGQLATWTDARGVACSLVYDGFARVTTETYSGPQSLTRTLAYNNRGLATAISEASPSSSSEIARIIDPYGQVASETVTLDGTALSTIAQAWDGAGRRKSLSPSSGPAFAYAHRADGVLSNVTVNGNSYSFAYGDNGLLSGRSGPARTENITRDSRGRVFDHWYNFAAGGGQVFYDGADWNADDTLHDYLAWGYTWYFEHDARRRLTEESVNAGIPLEWWHQYDQSPVPKLGVRTYSDWYYQYNGQWYALWANTVGSVDAFGRIESASVLGDKIPVTVAGESLGAGRVRAVIDPPGTSAPVSLGEAAIHEAWDDDGSWRLPHPQLTPYGSGFQLLASATHPSDHFTAWATNTFNVSGLQPSVASARDDMGNLASRTWSGIGNANRTQAFTWDACGRLAKVEQRDGNSDGFDFECVYDGLGRRIRTVERAVIDGTPDANSTVVTDTIFDPEVEFLEIAVWCGWEHGGGGSRLIDPENEGWTWKVYGPDLNGAFGGLQGIGGLEAIISPTTTVWPLHDMFGNVVGNVTNTGSVSWAPMAYTAFGPRTDKIVPSLLPGMPLHEALNYRGKRLDPTGDYWWGARYYDPTQGQFTSHDPMGYLDGSNPYAFCLNNPLVWQDADGRFSKEAIRHVNGGIAAVDDFGLNMFIGGGALVSYGLDWGMTVATGGGWLGGGTRLHAQGDALMAAMNPLRQFGYYKEGSYQDQARNAAELVAVAAGGAAGLNKLASLGDDLIRLGSNFKLPEFSLSMETKIGGWQTNPSQAGMLNLSPGFETGPHIALGHRLSGTRSFADEIGAQHLLDLPESAWKNEFLRHAGDSTARFSVNLRGFIGDTVEEMVLNEIKYGANTGWELKHLQEAGRLREVQFFLNGQAVRNPFGL